jgi:nucleoside-diphosphate-sugar epimerase
MKIFITGGTGFIGRHVIALLAAKGCTVYVFGRKEPALYEEPGKIIWLPGDLSSGEGLESINWSDIDGVIHLAAAGVKASNRAWPESLAVNVIGTQRLLNAIQQSACTPKLFLARTFYEKLISESTVLLENPYIATKAAGSEIGRIFASNYAGQVIFGTFFQVYGPGDDSGNVLSYAAKEFKAGRQAIFGSGKGMRDWIYITDAAIAIITAFKNCKNKISEVDIGSGELRTIREMVECLHSLYLDSPSPIFNAERDRDDINIALSAKNRVVSETPLILWKVGLKKIRDS